MDAVSPKHWSGIALGAGVTGIVLVITGLWIRFGPGS